MLPKTAWPNSGNFRTLPGLLTSTSLRVITRQSILAWSRKLTKDSPDRGPGLLNIKRRGNGTDMHINVFFLHLNVASLWPYLAIFNLAKQGKTPIICKTIYLVDTDLTTVVTHYLKIYKQLQSSHCYPACIRYKHYSYISVIIQHFIISVTCQIFPSYATVYIIKNTYAHTHTQSTLQFTPWLYLLYKRPKQINWGGRGVSFVDCNRSVGPLPLALVWLLPS